MSGMRPQGRVREVPRAEARPRTPEVDSGVSLRSRTQMEETHAAAAGTGARPAQLTWDGQGHNQWRSATFVRRNRRDYRCVSVTRLGYQSGEAHGPSRIPAFLVSVFCGRRKLETPPGQRTERGSFTGVSIAGTVDASSLI